METTKNKKQKTILDCELLGLHLERVEKKFHEMGIPEEDFVTNRLEDELEVLEWFVTMMMTEGGGMIKQIQERTKWELARA